MPQEEPRPQVSRRRKWYGPCSLKYKTIKPNFPGSRFVATLRTMAFASVFLTLIFASHAGLANESNSDDLEYCYRPVLTETRRISVKISSQQMQARQQNQIKSGQRPKATPEMTKKLNALAEIVKKHSVGELAKILSQQSAQGTRDPLFAMSEAYPQWPDWIDNEEYIKLLSTGTIRTTSSYLERRGISPKPIFLISHFGFENNWATGHLNAQGYRELVAKRDQMILQSKTPPEKVRRHFRKLNLKWDGANLEALDLLLNSGKTKSFAEIMAKNPAMNSWLSDFKVLAQRNFSFDWLMFLSPNSRLKYLASTTTRRLVISRAEFDALASMPKKNLEHELEKLYLNAKDSNKKESGEQHEID